MASRSKMSKRSSKRVFKKGTRTKRKNMAPPPMRGGYRL